MRIFRIDGADIHWREDGDPHGQPVMFANSLGTDFRVWDKVLPLLPDGLRFIRFDKRGHGLSSCEPGSISMQSLTADAAGLLDYLDIRDCIFVGLSIGGMIGQMLAATRPDLVRAMVLSNTAARMGDAQIWRDRIDAVAAHGIASIAPAVLERWFGPKFLRNPEVALWRNMLIRTPVDGYTGCCAAIAATDLTVSTAGLKLPVLGIGGSCDLASPPDLVAATAALVPNARFEEIAGAGHLPCVETPDAYAKLLSEFILENCHD